MKTPRLWVALIASLSCHALYAADSASGLVEKSKSLLNSGKAQESYLLLSKEQDSYPEDVDFNYLLGISALDAGKPGLAVFAFERVLAINPNHALARAEMGRAMFMMGELRGAKQELEQVRSMNPPPEAVRIIDQYLVEIGRAETFLAEQRVRTIWTAYLEAEFGYDTNINTSVNNSSIFVPVLSTNLVLNNPLFVAQESPFLGLNGGVAAQKPIKDDLWVFGSLDLKGRYNTNQSDFAPSSIYGTAGLRWAKGVDQYSLGVTTFINYIKPFGGQIRSDDQLGVFGQWQHEFSSQDVGGVFLQYARVDHPWAESETPLHTNFSTDLYMGGGFWTHAFLRPGDPVLSVAVYTGQERQLSNQETLGRDLYGAKANLEYKVREKMKLFGGVGAQHSRYGGTDPFFGEKRKDTRYDFNIGLAYKPSKVLTITPQVIYTKNDSTVGLNQWDRTQAMVTVRRDFF